MPVLLRICFAADVNPASASLAIPLEDELVEVAIHENCEPFAELLNVLDVDITRLTLHVLGRVAASYGSVESRAAIARGYDHGLSHLLSERFKDSLAEIAECWDELLRHCVVYSSGRGSGGA